MAKKDPYSFNFGANRKSRTPKSKAGKQRTAKSNAWRQYVGGRR
jgi:hypothetical protein